MTDDPTDAPGEVEAELTPAEEAEIAALLAEAGVSGPVPDDVAVRLDDALAALVAERGDAPLVSDDADDATPDVAPVVPLAGRRRRWPTALLAAAAVLVVGYGVSQVTTSNGGAADSAGSGSAALDAPEAGDKQAQGGQDAGGTTDYSAGTAAPLPTPLYDSLLGTRGALRLTYADFPDQVAAVVQDLDGSDNDLQSLSGRTRREVLGACTVPSLAATDIPLRARLEGTRATLVVSDARAGYRAGTAYGCSDGRILAFTRVPVD